MSRDGSRDSAAMIVRRHRQDADRPAHPVVRKLLGKNEPCPQSCWMMNSRISSPAASGAAQKRASIRHGARQTASRSRPRQMAGT